MKLNDLNQSDLKKFEKLKIKFETEIKFFYKKSKGIMDEFKKNRATELEK
jgi:hypothetical protein